MPYAPARSRPAHGWPGAIAAVAMLLSYLFLPAGVTYAASGTLYLDQATDPHGGIWLVGTTDGTTSGPLDPGTNTASRGFGHLWETDVPSGFCRVDTVVAANGSVSQQYARPNAYPGAPATGGCITPGQKASQPILEPRRNPDGTLYVYTCDWAVFSSGCYRMTYDPGAQVMTNTELLAPGRFPTAGGRGVKPFTTALGADGNLYVTSDLTPWIYRITNPNAADVGTQTVSVVGSSNSGTRIRATTWACWDPYRGGTSGLPTCAQAKAAGNPAPDLVLAEKSKVTVLIDVASCAGVPVDATGTGDPLSTPACLPRDTNLQVLTPMGAQTQGAWNQVVGAKGLPNWGAALDPNTIYITDSPGATSQIVRYTISTDTQDSYSNFGVLPDGTVAQYAFGFSPTQSPDGRMFLGDDPTAGANAFNGHIYTVPAKAPADAVGAKGAPATPPAPPALKVGAFVGGGTTLPNDGIWLPGSLGGHLWISDGVLGFCRIDAGGLNPRTCDLSTPAPGQPAFDATNNFVYLPDQSTGGVGVLRVTFDPKSETIVANSSVVVAPGQGLENQKTSGAALDPTTGALYVGFLNRNTTAPTEIARINNPASATPTVEFIANATRHKPIFTLAFIAADLYIGNNGGLDWIQNARACAAGQCASIQLLNVGGPRGMATDGTDHIYLAGPAIPAGCPPTCPAPGALTTPVQMFTVSTGDLSTFSTQGTLANGTLSSYEVVDSITVDPKGNVFVADDPSPLGTTTGQGRVFRVAAVSAEPSPTLTSQPTNPTNSNKPAFSYQSTDAAATFKCSLTAFGAADAFQNCGSSVTYGTDATGKVAQNGPNVLPDGLYVFRVEGVGAQGTSTPISYTFTIDTVAPTVSLTTQPKSPSNSNTPTFAFSSSAAQTTFACALTPTGGTAQFTPCASPFTFPAQVDGSYTFAVRATDAAGNQGTATASLVIDTTPPTLTASPAGGVFNTAQSVVLSASEPSTIYYTTDGSTPTTRSTSGASPLTVNVANTLTLSYFGVDAAGNASPVASQQYQIGILSLTQSPPAASNKNAPTFAFTDATAGATLQCSLVLQNAVDSFSPCTSPITYPAQPDGAYRFVVKDNGGNAAQVLFTIDTTPPVVSLTQNPPNPDTSSSATFAFTVNETGATSQCSFGPQTAADAFSACTSPATYGSLADGSYTFKVQATDLAGNVSSPVLYQFTVGASSAPVVTQAARPALVGLATLQSGTPGTTATAGPLTADASKGVPVTISWAGSACASGATGCNVDHYVLQESVNGLAFATVTLPSPTATSMVRTLKVSPINNSVAPTSYKYQLQVVDKTGRASAFSVSPAFTVPDVDNSFSSSFNGGWSGLNLAGAFGGSVQQSSTANAAANPASAQAVTSLAFVSTLGPDRGIAQIKVDGSVVGSVDLYAPTLQTAQVVWADNGLAAGQNHQIQVVVTGSKNAASTAARVDYDAILGLK